MPGTITRKFMDVPPEVLIVSMKTHQRYFATTKYGALANRFVVVANTVGAMAARPSSTATSACCARG